MNLGPKCRGIYISLECCFLTMFSVFVRKDFQDYTLLLSIVVSSISQ